MLGFEVFTQIIQDLRCLHDPTDGLPRAAVERMCSRLFPGKRRRQSEFRKFMSEELFVIRKRPGEFEVCPHYYNFS